MGPENAFLIASIASGLASVCVVLSLWSFVRLSRVEAKLADLDTKLPPKRVREMEEAFDQLATAFDGLQQKNQEWKQSVHGSVQRMDAIMRRNEKASNELLNEDGSINEDVVAAPPPSDVGVELDPVGVSKQAALRLRYNKNRGV